MQGAAKDARLRLAWKIDSPCDGFSNCSAVLSRRFILGGGRGGGGFSVELSPSSDLYETITQARKRCCSLEDGLEK